MTTSKMAAPAESSGATPAKKARLMPHVQIESLNSNEAVKFHFVETLDKVRDGLLFLSWSLPT
jgi:hypothetical protein